MPIITEQQACENTGKTAAACALESELNTARLAKAKESCAEFTEPRWQNECYTYCGMQASKPVHQCVSDLFETRRYEQQRAQEQTNLTIALAAVALLAVAGIWAFLRARRRALTP